MTDDQTMRRIETYFADPYVLLDDIDHELEAVPVEELPLIALDPAETDNYREVLDNRPRHAVLEAILISKENLADFCCRRARYCELKVRHGETISLVKALIDSAASVALTFPIPVATVLAYCVQSLFLDRLCHCQPGASS